MHQPGLSENSASDIRRQQYASLFESPNLLPWQLDLARARMLFAPIDEHTYRHASFLDQRLNADGKLKAFWVPLERVLADYRAATPKPSIACFIFHVGHCGSTLISRLLGDHPHLLSLREPLSLRTLAEAERKLGDQDAFLAEPRWRELLALVAHLLCRTYTDAQRALIKPSSNCNNLILPLLKSDSGNKAILLYLSLNSYLASVLRPQSRGALHIFYEQRLFDLQRLTSNAIVDLQELSPAQLGAMNWCASMTQFMRAIENNDLRARVKLIEFEAFLRIPEENLPILFNFLDIRVKQPEVDAILARGHMTTYAKDPQIGYTPKIRSEDLNLSLETHRAEIEGARNWLISFLDQVPSLASLKTLVTVAG